jgi:hypothetical protein
MWAQWDDAVPGFVEIVITVGHVGGNAAEDFCPTLTVTDIPTGWTEMATVKKAPALWVHGALADLTAGFPFGFESVGIDELYAQFDVTHRGREDTSRNTHAFT